MKIIGLFGFQRCRCSAGRGSRGGIFLVGSHVEAAVGLLLDRSAPEKDAHCFEAVKEGGTGLAGHLARDREFVAGFQLASPEGLLSLTDQGVGR